MAVLLLLRGVHAQEPMLEAMFLKYKQQPIDTTPVFHPDRRFYTARLDWKMQFFSVQALPVAPGVIDNIHICPRDADCSKQDQVIVTMDFTRNIMVPPGARVRHRFDVLLEGVTRTYTLIVHRLTGSETDIRHMVVEGATLYPDFHPKETSFCCFLPVNMEFASFELHLRDSGQTILSAAEVPVKIDKEGSNITSLRNRHPGQFRATPMRLRLRRRLRERDYGEFQYPNKYFQFPVPLATKRAVNFKVISSDGAHFGFYRVVFAREACDTRTPLFDASAGRCVSFCNMGFWADFEAKRCKRCRPDCLGCLSFQRCVKCPLPNRLQEFTLDNKTGSCKAQLRQPWEQHPQYALALALAALGTAIFFCGLVAFCMSQDARTVRGKHLPEGVPVASGAIPNKGQLRNVLAGQVMAPLWDMRTHPAAAGYAPVPNW